MPLDVAAQISRPSVDAHAPPRYCLTCGIETDLSECALCVYEASHGSYVNHALLPPRPAPSPASAPSIAEPTTDDDFPFGWGGGDYVAPVCGWCRQAFYRTLHWPPIQFAFCCGPCAFDALASRSRRAA